MRLMSKDDVTLKVIEHIIVKNFWEYYVCDAETNEGDTKLCVVFGDETEIGDVYLPELKPYIRTRTSDLKELAPAPGWRWVL